MILDLDAIVAAARSLSEADRLRLVEELLATLPEENLTALPDDQLEAELERRFAEYQADPSSAIPWRDVKRSSS